MASPQLQEWLALFTTGETLDEIDQSVALLRKAQVEEELHEVTMTCKRNQLIPSDLDYF